MFNFKRFIELYKTKELRHVACHDYDNSYNCDGCIISYSNLAKHGLDKHVFDSHSSCCTDLIAEFVKYLGKNVNTEEIKCTCSDRIAYLISELERVNINCMEIE